MTEMNAPKILVIEDETTQRILVKEYLEDRGYVVRLADDGQRGLEMARLLQVDLIILDLLLPSLDGYSLCVRLKEDPETANIPVILVTASREADVIERGFAAGASDFVTKPVDWNYLADRVAHVLRQSEHLRQLTSEKKASEQELEVLLGGKEGPAHQIALDVAQARDNAAQSNQVAREEFENQIAAVRSEADERVRKVEAAAHQEIKSERTARALEAETARREMDSMTQSLWSVIAATSDSHLAMLTSLDRLTTGASDEDAAGESGEFPVATHRENVVQSLLSSTRNLKLLSQHMTGDAELNERPVDLSELISQVITQLAPHSELRRLEIAADLPEAPVQVMADENRVRFAITSMVMNALKFCPPQGTVRIRLTANPHQPVQVRIEDNGTGMAPALVETLRESVVYPANALQPRNGRLGFGIPMSTAIMKLHAGALEIESEAGTGTAITLSFPNERNCAANAAPHQSSTDDKPVASTG